MGIRNVLPIAAAQVHIYIINTNGCDSILPISKLLMMSEAKLYGIKENISQTFGVAI